MRAACRTHRRQQPALSPRASRCLLARGAAVIPLKQRHLLLLVLLVPLALLLVMPLPAPLLLVMPLLAPLLLLFAVLTTSWRSTQHSSCSSSSSSWMARRVGLVAAAAQQVVMTTTTMETRTFTLLLQPLVASRWHTPARRRVEGGAASTTRW